MADYKFPTEMVELPSKGHFYFEGHPLSSGKVEIKYMTAKEEDILTSQNLIQQGTVIDKLLESLVVDKSINLDDMLVGDKNAIMVASRILGYGKDYKFTYDGKEHSVDLSELEPVELDFSKFPSISDSVNHKGYKYPMGISNHSFYETYKTVNENPVEENPYYGFLYNQNQEWLDSHFFGVDGPLFFWDKSEEGLLHLYILAFERHSYVGHYTFKMN